MTTGTAIKWLCFAIAVLAADGAAYAVGLAGPILACVVPIGIPAAFLAIGALQGNAVAMGGLLSAAIMASGAAAYWRLAVAHQEAAITLVVLTFVMAVAVLGETARMARKRARQAR